MPPPRREGGIIKLAVVSVRLFVACLDLELELDIDELLLQ